MDLIDVSSGHSIQVQKNTLFSQVQMEHSPGQVRFWVTKQASENIRKVKSHQETFLTTTL